MGIRREHGYSATVSGYFVTQGERIRLAKTNGKAFVLSEPRDMPPGTEGHLVVEVDGEVSSRKVVLPDGAIIGETIVSYLPAVPF